MYIAHHLVTLGHHFNNQRQSSGDADLNSTRGEPEQCQSLIMTYVDLVPSIKRLGVECFLQMMTLQKDQMIECLAQAEGVYLLFNLP